MAEFKKLSEVEQIETASDNATVLIEEDGDIKRVPKKEVGGAGGYVATLTENDLNNSSSDMLVLSENYDELYEVLMAGGSGSIDATVLMSSLGGANALNAPGPEIPIPSAFGIVKSSIVWWATTDAGLIGQFLFMGEPTMFIFPNGSHNIVVTDK